jgi:hypothetical protein
MTKQRKGRGNRRDAAYASDRPYMNDSEYKENARAGKSGGLIAGCMGGGGGNHKTIFDNIIKHVHFCFV